MSKEKYIEDIRHIREMMQRSSRFISLSGMAGVVSGIIALLGAYWAYAWVYHYQTDVGYRIIVLNDRTIFKLLMIAILTLSAAMLSGWVLTRRKARKQQVDMWSEASKQFFFSIMIPMITGGLLCLLLLTKGFIGLMAPLTLLFYGLGLVNASKYTLDEIKYLGLMEIVLGLFSVYFVGYGLIFWAMGFGVLHIVYGLVMYRKYDS